MASAGLKRGRARPAPITLTATQRRLLNAYQHDLPLSPTPYRDMAERLGMSEQAVLDCLAELQAAGVVSRVGPVFRPRRLGSSTLAAMRVPPERLAEVAELVNGYPEVNHNYERHHEFNLWFVLTAPDRARIDAVLAELRERTGLPVLDLPLEQDYHIDLGFPLWC